MHCGRFRTLLRLPLACTYPFFIGTELACAGGTNLYGLMSEDLDLKDILKASGFRFNKALGQNFITDGNLLCAIVADSGVTSEDVVIEIGTGAGTLTRALAATAKRVISFEVDKNLAPVLDLSLKGIENAEVVFRDILRMTDEELTAIVGCPFKVVANLPYYVTTPMILRFLESELPSLSLTVMVQKEVADRLVANVGSPDYSSISLAVQAAGNARITRAVGKKMFYPMPSVDSAVVRIDVDRNKLSGENVALVKKIIRAAFAMRRKTLVNNLVVAFGVSKAEGTAIVEDVGLSPLVRGEALSLSDFVALSRSPLLCR